MSVMNRGFRKLRDSVARARYAPGFSQAEQERTTIAAIAAAGLDCTMGLDVLNAVLHDIRGMPFNFAKDSVHWLLFACLTRSTEPVARILEIGTFDGQFTAILARLFPSAEIVTVDLPESDPILRSTYERELDTQYQRFVATRSGNLAAPNIRFRQFNSAFLLDNVQGPFDLIWVDGGHLYPEVAWDIAAAHHLCREGGYLLCDDVIPALDGQRTAYVSPDSFQVLRYVADRTGATLHLFLKRCGFKHAVVPRTRKFVAMLERLRVVDAS
ncbi:MAG: class I SAM-dependent methyltransferase [Proteobacteria bacterium]|nr:class I SAM-dependent methyltransferase [Pseudomonadota bacterium]